MFVGHFNNLLEKDLPQLSESLFQHLLSSGILAESTSVNVFAHELGHSLGAKHDDLVSDCNPVGSDSYLMTGNSKVLKNNFLGHFQIQRIKCCT